MHLFRLLLVLGLTLPLIGCGSPSSASEDPQATHAGPLRISKAWMRTPNEATDTDAVYLVIRNTGAEEDQLLGATTDAAATVELHQSITTDGVVAMRPIKAIPIPAGGAVAIEAGAYHLMLLGRTRLTNPGDTIALNLTFARAGTVALHADVRDSAPTSEGGDRGDSEHEH